MAFNKRLQRKSLERSDKKRQLDADRGRGKQSPETMLFDIIAAFIGEPAHLTHHYHDQMRDLKGATPTAAWQVANNVFEAVAFGRKPSPVAPADCDGLRVKYSTFRPEIVTLLDIQDYAGLGDWDDPQHPLCQAYQKGEKQVLGVMDLPILAHFFGKGWINPASSEAGYLLKMIDILVDELTCYEVMEFSKQLHLTDKPCPKGKLALFEGSLRTLDRQAKHEPVFTGFLKPWIEAVVGLYYRPMQAKLSKSPMIMSYLTTNANANAQAVNGFRWEDPTKITFDQLSPEVIHASTRSSEGVPDFRLFIKKQIVAWRFWAEGQVGVSGDRFREEEERVFKSLWSSLSHGVPLRDRDFAMKTKEVCAEFFQKLIANSIRYKPKPSIVREFVKYDGSNDGFRWLLYSVGGVAERLLGDKPNSQPKMMPFLLFYNLYVNQNLSKRVEFIDSYFVLLPRESQREILSQWFQRVQLDMKDPLGLDRVSRLTFDKLLAADRFPVADLETVLELDPAVLVWSLAYMKFKKRPCPLIGYQKGIAVVNYLLKTSSKVFYDVYGAGLVIDLLPQLCQPESYRLGVVGQLLELVSKFKNSNVNRALEAALKSGRFREAPVKDQDLLRKAVGGRQHKLKKKGEEASLW